MTDGDAAPLAIALDVSSAVDPRPSGVARYIRGLVEGLSREPGVSLALLCRASRWRRGDPRALFPEVRRWRDWARPRGLDLFHAPDLRPPRRPPSPLVVTVHDLSALDRADHATARFLARKRRALAALAAATRVVTHTAAVRDDLIARLGLAPERVAVVPLWPGLPLGAGAPLGAGELLAIGGPSARKRSDRLAPFLDRLAAATGLSPAVAWTGSAAPPDAAAFFAALPPAARARTRWLGHLDDEALDRRLRGAGALLQLSDTEGFGIPLLEAAARRIPLLVWRSRTAEEVIGDGAFWLGGEDEAGELRAFADGAERARRFERAAARAAGFTRARTVAGTLAVYRDAVTSGATAAVG